MKATIIFIFSGSEILLQGKEIDQLSSVTFVVSHGPENVKPF